MQVTTLVTPALINAFAGRGPALMRAWLQIRVDGRAACCVTGLLERDGFGMTDASVSVEAFADDAAILDDDGPDHRPRAC